MGKDDSLLDLTMNNEVGQNADRRPIPRPATTGGCREAD